MLTEAQALSGLAVIEMAMKDLDYPIVSGGGVAAAQIGIVLHLVWIHRLRQRLKNQRARMWRDECTSRRESQAGEVRWDGNRGDGA